MTYTNLTKLKLLFDIKYMHRLYIISKTSVPTITIIANDNLLSLETLLFKCPDATPKIKYNNIFKPIKRPHVTSMNNPYKKPVIPPIKLPAEIAIADISTMPILGTTPASGTSPKILS